MTFSGVSLKGKSILQIYSLNVNVYKCETKNERLCYSQSHRATKSEAKNLMFLWSSQMAPAHHRRTIHHPQMDSSGTCASQSQEAMGAEHTSLHPTHILRACSSLQTKAGQRPLRHTPPSRRKAGNHRRLCNCLCESSPAPSSCITVRKQFVATSASKTDIFTSPFKCSTLKFKNQQQRT